MGLPSSSSHLPILQYSSFCASYFSCSFLLNEMHHDLISYYTLKQ